LALDVQRYLADEPVLAGPPGTGYRLRKFVRRNKAAVAVTGIVLVLLMLLGGGSGWVVRDRAARRSKTANDLDRAVERTELFLGQKRLSEARAALDGAGTLAQELPADPGRDERLANLNEQLDAADRDREFVAEYEKIRLKVESQVDVATSTFKEESIVPEIRDLLRRYGIVVGETTPDQAAALIRGRSEPVSGQLVAAIQDCVVYGLKEDKRSREWFRTVLLAADADPWRVALRTAARVGDLTTIERLIRDVDVGKHPPGLLILLAEVLPEELKSTRLELLRRIQRANPDDLWANMSLAAELFGRARYSESARFLTAAIALRPDNPGLYLNRGSCLAELSEPDAAIEDFQKCLLLAPRYAGAMTSLADAWRKKGKLQEALALSNSAIEIDPRSKRSWANRALAFQNLKQYEKAIADNTRAIELDERYAAAWANRAEAHRLLRQYDLALADSTKAIALDERAASAWSNRADCYLQSGEVRKAVADATRSIELDPTDAFAWYIRGGAYLRLGDSDKAVADCSRGVDLRPDDPWAHYNLGTCLFETGHPEKGVAALRRAIVLDDTFPEAHCNLGHALRQSGQFAEALKEFKRGDELGRKNPVWPYPSADWVQMCKRLVELDGRLPEYLSGVSKPSSPEERIELAELCAYKRLYRAAVRFYDEAFSPLSVRTAPLVGAHRYNAACSAALAGCGQGQDAEKPDEQQRTRLRLQALGWLRGTLETVGRLIDSQPARRADLAKELNHWKTDPDLEGVRDGPKLARLPATELQSWQQFWDDVNATLKRAAETPTQKTPDPK
jgi:tetratricopeptide (TPR) repeat protein